MEPEGLLPCLHEPATGPCPEPDESNPHSPVYFLKVSFNVVLFASSGGECLQVWTLATNALNKQLRTAYKVWLSSFGIERGAYDTPREKAY
jgi:hypothetical protein